MANRYNKFVIEAEEGITFEVSEETNGDVIIRARNISNNILSEFPAVSAGEYAEVLSVYTDDDGNKAVVPQGWTVSGVPKENIIWGKDKGLVIYQIPKVKVGGINWQNEVESLMKTYDQLVWTPVSLLKSNGTLDGFSFTEKFGRRNYREINFSKSEYHEPLTGELALQKESVNKYGGYYSTRYTISKDPETGYPRSIKGKYPWTSIDFLEMKQAASNMFKGSITGHVMYGAEYDTREEWIIETKTKTFCEIAKDSTALGNYVNTKNSSKKVVKTGSRKSWCFNNIYDFTGNVNEQTQEKYSLNQFLVVRGGGCRELGFNYPADYRSFVCLNNICFYTGFRVTAYIGISSKQ